MGALTDQDIARARWAREGRLSAQDGHWDAAAAAYAQALQLAATGEQRTALRVLLADAMTHRLAASD